MKRGITGIAIKVFTSVALIAAALRGVDLTAVGSQLAAAHPHHVAGAFALVTGISLIHAERWCLVLRRLRGELAFRQAVRLVLIGYFFNLTLPSTIGGDVFRIWGVSRSGVTIQNAASSVLIDRGGALISLVLMIAAGLPWLFELLVTPQARWVVVMGIAGGAFGLILVLTLDRFADVLNRWRATRLFLSVAEDARAVFFDGKTAVRVLILTTMSYVVVSYSVYLLALGLSIELGFGNALLLIPLVTLVTILPISIAGWGLREGAMVVALGLIGVPAAAAFSLSVLYGLVGMASGLPGGVLWLSQRRDAAAASVVLRPQE